MEFSDSLMEFKDLLIFKISSGSIIIAFFIFSRAKRSPSLSVIVIPVFRVYLVSVSIQEVRIWQKELDYMLLYSGLTLEKTRSIKFEYNEDDNLVNKLVIFCSGNILFLISNNVAAWVRAVSFSEKESRAGKKLRAVSSVILLPNFINPRL
jgi:hypothetical protein